MIRLFLSQSLHAEYAAFLKTGFLTIPPASCGIFFKNKSSNSGLLHMVQKH
jgi:hypothetical protein